MGFVHLHCHSAYSLLEGTATPQALISTSKKLRMPALALTDRNNLLGVIPFYVRAQQAGIKPLVGMEVDLDDGSSLVLLARNMDGYRNLCHLATILRLNADPDTLPPAGFDEEEEEAGEGNEILPWEPSVRGAMVFGLTGRQANRISKTSRLQKEPCLPRELLLSGRHVRGLIALSGGRRGLVNSLVMGGKVTQAARAAGMLLSAFGEGNFFIEIQALDQHDAGATPQLVSLANDLGIPIVATNDVLYLAPEDTPIAQALAAARRGNRLTPQASTSGLWEDNDTKGIESSERYFKSAEMMAELLREYPQALANTHFIAEQCNVDLPLHKPIFPSVDLKGEETPFSKLWKLCFAGATRRYRPLTEGVIARLKYELEVIEGLGFSPYFLVVHDIVHFAHSRDIPVMARGSAPNSLAAYVLGISQVDPLQNGLLFERFLNSSRAEFEMPDIDLDLCWRRRDEVLHYIYERYGRDHVAIVGTHITFRLRSAWREMAKALGVKPDRINRIAAKLPHFLSPEDILSDSRDGADASDLAELTDTPDDYQPVRVDAPDPKLQNERERQAFELCKAIEGLPRHAGMHCAGVVIAPGRLADLVPLQRAARDPSMAITQYDKDAIEAMGLVKIDLLGSRALTTLVDSIQSSGLAHAKGDVTQALQAIPLDDEATYRMMAEGDTLGCFQLESPGMRGLLKWLRPHNLNDVAMAVSLFRPGPLEGGFLETFMRRHLGQEPVSYHHPTMEPLLKVTNGVILYQEQFLQLVHELAGLDLGEAERLRKKLGKTRSPEERTRLGAEFIAGAIERGIDQLQAEKVWEIVAGYSGFGFCKAHALSYALNAYRSAYMKAHYPAHFMAAQINNGGGYYGTAVYVEEARRLRIGLLLPHVNDSGAWCEVPHGSRSIRFGLQFVKGLSARTITNIIAERRSGGRFRSLRDLLSRVEMSPTEVTVLVKVGACDNLMMEGGIPALAPIRGSMGEPIGAYYEPKLNRNQMMWLIPSLLTLSANKSAMRRADRRAYINWSQATGSDGLRLGMQMIIGDFIGQEVAHKILGETALHFEVPSLVEYTPAEKLRLEREALGFTLSHNEMEIVEVQDEGLAPSGELYRYADRSVKVAGVVVAGRRHTTKDGEPMLFFSLQDRDGLVEVVLFPDAYRTNREELSKGGHGPYVVTGQVQVSGKGRGVGVQPPATLRVTDAVTMKMHPVVIAKEIKLLHAGNLLVSSSP